MIDRDFEQAILRNHQQRAFFDAGGSVQTYESSGPLGGVLHIIKHPLLQNREENP